MSATATMPEAKGQTHTFTGRVKNYKVRVAKLGGYSRGAVIPRSAILQAAGAGAAGQEESVIAGMVNRKIVEETYDIANVDISVPSAPVLTKVDAEIMGERNTLLAENENLKRKNAALEDKTAAAEKLVTVRDKELGNQVATIAALQEQLGARDELLAKTGEEIAALTATNKQLAAELEAATAPPTTKKTTESKVK